LQTGIGVKCSIVSFEFFCVDSCLHLVKCEHCLWFCKVARVWLDR
jgi:hypothetical protein